MKLLVGSYTEDIFGKTPTGSKGIYSIELDEKTGKMEIVSHTSDTVNPSYLSVSSDGRSVVSCSEVLEGGKLAWYNWNADGSFSLMDQKKMPGCACCYVEFSKNGRYLLGTNYGDGTAFTVELFDGKFGEIKTWIAHSGKGVNAKRQDSAHAHSFRELSAGSKVMLCDLGLDKVFCYQATAAGELTEDPEQSSLVLPDGFGPRMIAVSEDEKCLYTVGELKSEIQIFIREEDRYMPAGIVCTLPKSGDILNNLAAEIKMYQGYLYVSNRGDDSIACFKVSGERLSEGRWYSCGGNGPRCFTIKDNWLVCANQNSGTICSFRIDERGGLSDVCGRIDIAAPSFVKLV